MAGEPRRQLGEVVGEQRVDQLRHAGAVGPGRDEVGALLDGGQRVGDRHRALAQRQERVVVLGVADADDVVRRQAQLSSAAVSPVALLTPDGSTITAPLLKITCSSSPRSRMVSSTTVSCGSQVATMTCPTDSGATPRRRSASTNALRRRARRGASPRGWPAGRGAPRSRPRPGRTGRGAGRRACRSGSSRPVTRMSLRPEAADALQRRERGGVDDAVVGEGAVVVAGEGEIAHGLQSTPWPGHTRNTRGPDRASPEIPGTAARRSGTISAAARSSERRRPFVRVEPHGSKREETA